MIQYLPSMPLWIWSLLALLGCAALGFATIGIRNKKSNDEVEFFIEFRNKLIDYINSRGSDSDSYHWLTLNANLMQQRMGSDGIWAVFRDPPFKYNNYPFVINGLMKIRDIFSGDNFGRDPFGNDGRFFEMMESSLLRFIGERQAGLLEDQREIRNPLSWLRYGARDIVSLPLHILLAFGLIGSETFRRTKRSPAFKALSFLFIVVLTSLAVLSDIAGLVTSGRSAWQAVLSWVGVDSP
jgi:hypothetical protein